VNSIKNRDDAKARALATPKPAAPSPPGAPKRIDGRRARSLKTRSQIIAAYLALVHETKGVPTSEQVAQQAGLSTRAVFSHFSDLEALGVASFDQILARGLSTPAGDKTAADRPTRIRFHVEIRARNCETWLPLWRVVIQGGSRSPEIRHRIKMVRELVRARINLMYGPELSTLSDGDRTATVSAIESVTDFESWGRLRGHYGLSYEATCNAWIYAIERLLPPTPAQSR
jgi:AcrR family transcriptional regulator